MHTIDPKLPLVSLGKPILRVAVGWREALSVVRAVGEKAQGASLGTVLERTAEYLTATEGTTLTLGEAVVDALLASKSAESCGGAEKLRRWELAQRFNAGAPFELKAEDIVFVDACLAEQYKPSIYGPAHDALNGVQR